MRYVLADTAASPLEELNSIAIADSAGTCTLLLNPMMAGRETMINVYSPLSILAILHWNL